MLLFALVLVFGTMTIISCDDDDDDDDDEDTINYEHDNGEEEKKDYYNKDTPNDIYDAFAFDDFVVPTGQTWTIDKFFIPGSNSALANSDSLNVHIYENVITKLPANVPSGWPIYGAAPLWSEVWTLPSANVTFNGTNDSVELLATSAPVLTEGMYWICFYPDLDKTTYGQWYWMMSDTLNGDNALLINPGGGFGVGTGWVDIKNGLGTTSQDLAFTMWECAD